MAILRLLLILCVLVAAYAVALIAAFVPYGWALPVLVLIAVVVRRGKAWTSHGTARWANVSDVEHMLHGNGLIVGHIDGMPPRITGFKALFNHRVPSRIAVEKFLLACQGPMHKPRNLVRLTQAVHTAVFAPTGVGKGVSCILPFLLTCPDSCVVVDFKGENYKISGNTRRSRGHRVVRLDPFGVCGPGSDTLNPLEFIDRDSPTAIDECRDLAEALVIRTGQEKDPHWQDAAEIWISAMTAAVIAFADDGDKNLQSVRALLTNPQKMQAAIKLMCESDRWEGMLARLGHQLTQFQDRELGSTLTSTNRFLRFLDTISVSENTVCSSFNPAALLNGKTTVYLILPPEHMRSQGPLLRLWVGALMRACLKGGLQEKHKVHFVCDEANSLGKMDQLSDMLTIGRAYGIRLQLYYQDCGQLKKCWPDGADQTILANTSQVYFGVNDHATAELVSKRLGEGTIIVGSGGSGSGSSESTGADGKNSSGRNWNTSDNWSQLGRKLLKPEEVTGLDPRVAITMAPGVPPIATWLVRYYEKGFKIPRRMGLGMAIVQTICLLALAALLAVLFTAINKPL